ncbi:hypothetical protein [Niveibacterium microcysteis]|uniref:Uncharacterized protein n=1 Tax=Niveibacterium microcysteis TaxID=2811415 RepID=A0ABX7MCS0_9RHOO|nr:hypothetical protein [Niveibacterium microcysteis]QSI78781.1 hypothetical protein JY500_09320 [Niveibacterium microcysteis]
MSDILRHEFVGSLVPGATLRAVRANGGTSRVFYGQGELDGACGIYCLLTAARAHGSSVSFEKCRRARDSERRSFYEASREHFFDGTTLSDLVRLATQLNVFGSVQRISGTPRILIERTIKALEKGSVVALAFKNRRGEAHWTLAVGVEHRRLNAGDQPTAILCIDSGQVSPTLTPHNARIELALRGQFLRPTDYVADGGVNRRIHLYGAVKLAASSETKPVV